MAEKTSSEKNEGTEGKDVRSELKESAQRIWLAGLGAFAVAEQEGSKMFNTLVERGKEWEAEGRGRVDEVREKARSKVGGRFEDIEGKIDARITDALHRFGVPTRDEIRELSRRVEELTAKLDDLHGTRGTGSAN